MIIDDVAPNRASYRPGEVARVTVTLTNELATPIVGRLSLSLRCLDRELDRLEMPVTVVPGLSELTLDHSLPSTAPCGYGLDVTFVDETGNAIAEGSGALDVLEWWSQRPRYGFLSDFPPDADPAEINARVDSLCRYHLNVVQFYDWMWRHYRLLPPSEEFADALGRRLSLTTVRALIAGVQERGMAAFAYGAVYGAEPEFADVRPELVLLDDEGKRISLAELFYIMNIAPDSPWVSLIVAEFAEVVRVLGFDGIHLDQYGFPKTAVTAIGERVDLAEHFPLLIDRARVAVVAERPDAGVIFNAVGNWPIETVAPTSQDAVYVEVWPPDEDYADLRRLIHDGKRLSGGKPVILAAYLSPFLDAEPSSLAEAETAALLATATIAASGGSHLLLGEREGVLCDPYYPKYATLRGCFVDRMRTYYDFVVRYGDWLVGQDVEPDDGLWFSLAGARLARDPEPGAVWAIGTRKGGYRMIHLINLTDQADTTWNALRTPPAELTDFVLTLDGVPSLRRAMVLTPDADYGRPREVELTRGEAGGWRLRLPLLGIWSMIVCEVDEGGEN
ncbi:MAG: dextranase [Thermomicrobiales bacterium]|nr:dextranase [Thermomicrobiales bacterium]